VGRKQFDKESREKKRERKGPSNLSADEGGEVAWKEGVKRAEFIDGKCGRQTAVEGDKKKRPTPCNERPKLDASSVLWGNTLPGRQVRRGSGWSSQGEPETPYIYGRSNLDRGLKVNAWRKKGLKGGGIEGKEGKK